MTPFIKRRSFMGLAVSASFVSCSRKDEIQSTTVTRAPAFRYFEIQKPFSILHLHWKRPDRTPFGTIAALHAHLQAEGREPLCIMNAGIFNVQQEPLGWHVQDGEELRPLNRDTGEGNFFMQPNGVFAISADHQTATIRPTHGPQEPNPSLATQSGPLLLHEGAIHPQFNAQSANLNIRNGVGIRDDGSVVMAISEGPVRFYDFAMYFKQTHHCRDALYLDGTISRCWIKSEGKPPIKDQNFAGLLAVVA